LQESISNQAYIFLYSVIGGMLIAFIFDLFRIKRKAIKTSTVMIYVEDFFYWIIAALVMFAIVYLSNDGELRGYIFLGTVIGAALYIVLLSKVVIKISLKLLWLIYVTVKTVWKIISYPVRFLLKVLSVPGMMIYNLISRCLKKARLILRTNITKTSISRKIFKNARKKI
jgi:spore cortex biosynthesis protein YabQ